MEKVHKQDLKVSRELPALVGEALAGPGGEGSDGPAKAVSASAQEQAQHLKILRVLRFMVLPEMTRRLLGS